jgi:hypothetical protein
MFGVSRFKLETAESWENTKTGLVSNVYYWESLEALEQLMRHPAHIVNRPGNRGGLSV